MLVLEYKEPTLSRLPALPAAPRQAPTLSSDYEVVTWAGRTEKPGSELARLIFPAVSVVGGAFCVKRWG